MGSLVQKENLSFLSSFLRNLQLGRVVLLALSGFCVRAKPAYVTSHEHVCAATLLDLLSQT